METSFVVTVAFAAALIVGVAAVVHTLVLGLRLARLEFRQIDVQHQVHCGSRPHAATSARGAS